MFKALLISLATLISYDAVAWQGSVRHEIVHGAGIALRQVAALDWSWG